MNQLELTIPPAEAIQNSGPENNGPSGTDHRRRLYEEKRRGRIERLQERADKAASQANALHSQARKMAGVIPFGQPILVGHHSEGRDRRYRARIEGKFRKSFEALDKAKHYERKVDAAENNRAISSDNPDAVTELQAKLAKLEARQKHMVAANRFIRSKNDGGLRGMGLTDEQIAKIKEPDMCGRIGFPSYALQNNNANIRRIKERIAELSRRAADQTTERELHGVRIVENADENRLQLFFKGKPPEEIRKALKSRGFHYSRFKNCWQRQRAEHATRAAEEIITRFHNPATTT